MNVLWNVIKFLVKLTLALLAVAAVVGMLSGGHELHHNRYLVDVDLPEGE